MRSPGNTGHTLDYDTQSLTQANIAPSPQLLNLLWKKEVNVRFLKTEMKIITLDGSILIITLCGRS